MVKILKAGVTLGCIKLNDVRRFFRVKLTIHIDLYNHHDHDDHDHDHDDKCVDSNEHGLNRRPILG